MKIDIKKWMADFQARVLSAFKVIRKILLPWATR